MARPKKNLSAAEIKSEKLALNAKYNEHVKARKAAEKAVNVAKKTMTKEVALADKSHKAAITASYKTLEGISKAQGRVTAAATKAIDKIQARIATLDAMGVPAVQPITPTIPTSTKRVGRPPKALNGAATATVQ